MPKGFREPHKSSTRTIMLFIIAALATIGGYLLLRYWLMTHSLSA